MAEPDLGAGNFLDKAYAANPNRAVPFAFSHHLDHRGEVVLKGHSLEDLAGCATGTPGGTGPTASARASRSAS